MEGDFPLSLIRSTTIEIPSAATTTTLATTVDISSITTSVVIIATFNEIPISNIQAIR